MNQQTQTPPDTQEERARQAQSLYFGPYISCKNEMLLQDTDVARCSSSECRSVQKADHKFCPYCGSEVEEITVSTTTGKKVDAASIANELRTGIVHFSEEGLYDFFVPVEKRRIYYQHGRHIQLGNPVNGYAYVTSVTLESDHEWLMENYKLELERIREVYGKENVDVVWGLLIGPFVE